MNPEPFFVIGMLIYWVALMWALQKITPIFVSFLKEKYFETPERRAKKAIKAMRKEFRDNETKETKALKAKRKKQEDEEIIGQLIRKELDPGDERVCALEWAGLKATEMDGPKGLLGTGYAKGELG